MTDLEEKFRSDPENIIVFRELVAQYQAQSQWERLANLYTERAQYLKKRDMPEAVGHFLDAGRTQRHHLKNPAKAYQLFSQALALEPESETVFVALEEVCLELKQWKELFQIYCDKLEMTEERKARLDLLCKAAVICEQHLNLPDQAISLYSRARELDPKNSVILKSLAGLFERQSQWMSAIDVCQTVLKTAEAPDERDKINFQIGSLCEKLNDRERAAAYYRAIRSPAYQPEALARLERLYEKDPANLALVLTEKLEFLQDTHTKALTYKKLARLQQNREAAIAFYQRALELLPKDLELLKEVSQIFWDKGQIEVWFEYAMRQVHFLDNVTEKVRLLHDIATKLTGRKDINLLIKSLEMVLEVMPQDRQAVDRLIQIYRQEKRSEPLLKTLMHKSKYCSITEAVSTYFQIAKLLSESLQKEDEAKVYYQKVLQLQEDHHGSLDQLKEQYLKTGNYQGFLDILQKKIALEPARSAQFHYERGKVYRDLLQDLEQAIEAFQKAIDADPRSWPAFEALLPLLKSKCFWEKYLTVAERALLVLKDARDATALHISAAEIYLKKGEQQRAEEHLLSVLRQDPAHAQVLDKLAAMYQDERRWQNYIEILETAARFLGTPDDLPKRYLEIAQVHTTIAQYPQAIAYYEKAHALVPFQDDILEQWQKLLEAHGDQEKLLYCLAMRLKLASNTEAAVAFLTSQGDVYLQRQEPAKAMAAYEEALARKSHHGPIIDKLIPLYEAAAETAKLFNLLEQKSSIVSDTAARSALFWQLATLAEKLTDLESAIRYLEKFWALSPGHVQAMAKLGELYPKRQMWGALIKLQRKQLELAGKAAEKTALLKEMAKIYEHHLDDPWELKNVYREILALNPSEPTILILTQLQKLQKLCHKLEDWKGLVEAYQQEIAQTTAEDRLAKLYQETGKIYQTYLPNITQAIACFQKSVEYDPEDYQIWQSLHQLYLVQRDYEHAIGVIDRELKLLADPELEANLLVEKGILYRDRLYNDKLAIQSLQAALTLCPTLREAIDALEIIYRSEKSFPELLQLLASKQSLLTGEEALELLVEMARIYDEHLQNEAEAEKYLWQVLNQATSHAEAARRLIRLYQKQASWDKLEKFYQRQLAYLREPKPKAALLFVLGKLYEEKLNDISQAAAAYVKVINTESGHLGAIKSLQKIYEQQNPKALTEAYLAELAVPEILPRRRITLHFACAQLFDQEPGQEELASSHYQQVLKHDPDNLLAIRGLQALYRRQNEWRPLTKMLLAELSLEQDVKRLLLLHLELSDLYAAMEDPEATIKHLSKAYRYQPENTAILDKLKTILREKGFWSQYCEYVQEELEHALLTDRQRLNLELSRIYQDRLGNSEKSIEHLEKALTLGNLQAEDLHRLQAMYQALGVSQNARHLIRLFDIEKESAPGKERLAELWQKMSELYEEPLQLPEKAASCLEELLKLAPLKREAYQRLNKLYTQLEAWPKLAQLLVAMTGISSESKEKEEWLLKAGNIWEKKLQENGKATSLYQMVLTINANNLSALQGMRRLYEKDKNWHGVLEILYEEARLCSGAEQATVYLKIARIWETRLNTIPQAVAAYLQVMNHYYHQPTAEHLLTLLKGLKEYETFCQVIPKIIKRTPQNEQKAEMLCEMGNILCRELGRCDDASHAYQKALKYAPKKLEAISGLEEIYQKQETWPDLAKIKELKLELVSSSSQIRKLHLELGQIWEHRLYDEKKAIFHYERALELMPQDFQLIHILEKLYQDWGYFHRYIEVCTREIDITPEAPRKLNLYHQIAYTWEFKLLDDLHAIQSLEKILELDNKNAEAITALLRLYERNHDYRNQVRLYEIRAQEAKQSSQTEAFITRKIKMGNLLKDKLYDYAEAERAFRAVLEVSAHNQEAIRSLESMFQSAKKLTELCEIVSHKIQLSQDLREKAQLYFQLGQIYEAQNDAKAQSDANAKALDAYHQAHAIEPHNREVLYRLQNLYRQTNNLQALVTINQDLAALCDKDSDKIRFWWENCQLLKESDPAQASAYLDKIVTADPKNTEALVLFTTLLERNNDWEKLEKALKIWITYETNPKEQSGLYLRRGYLYLRRLNLRDKALSDFQAAFEKDRVNLEATVMLATLYYELEAWDKAEPIYEQLAVWPDREQLKLHNLPEIYWRWSKLAENLQKPQIALVRYQKMLEIVPDQPLALKALGNIYYDNRQWEQALLIYMKLNSIVLPDVETAEVILRLAIIKDKMGMTEGAIAGYQQVLENNPHDLVAMEALGLLFLARKELEKAYDCFQKLRQATHDLAIQKRTLVWLAQICENLGKIPEAIERYQDIIKIEGPNPQHLKKLLELYYSAKLWDRALACGEELHKLLAGDLEKIEVEMTLGYIMWEGYQNQEKAVGYFEAVLTRIPTYLAAIRAMVKIYQSQENWAQVADTYDRCMQRFPDQSREQKIPLLLEEAKVLQEKLGKPKEAIPLYEKVLQVAPDHAGAHAALAVLWAKYPEKRGDAITGQRYLINEDPLRVLSYHELFRLYLEDKEYDRGYLCCQALESLGALLPEEAKFLKQVPPRVSAGWLDPWTLDQLVRDANRGALYEIMASVDPYTDKAYPAVLESKYQVAKQDKVALDVESPVATVIAHIVHLLGIQDLQVYLSNAEIIGIDNTQPPSLVIGRPLLEKLKPGELSFIIGHYLFYVSRSHVMALKLSGAEYRIYVSRLVEAFADTGKEMSVAEENVSRKLRFALLKRIRKQLEERMDILSEIYQADIPGFLKGLELGANKCGLLCADSLRDSIQGYLYLQKQIFPFQGIQQPQEAIANLPDHFSQIAEVKDLFWFNLSDQHSKLRTELGLAIKWIR